MLHVHMTPLLLQSWQALLCSAVSSRGHAQSPSGPHRTSLASQELSGLTGTILQTFHCAIAGAHHSATADDGVWDAGADSAEGWALACFSGAAAHSRAGRCILSCILGHHNGCYRGRADHQHLREPPATVPCLPRVCSTMPAWPCRRQLLHEASMHAHTWLVQLKQSHGMYTHVWRRL